MHRRYILILILFLNLFASSKGFSQQSRDTVVDGVVAVVGGNMILKSDIEAQYL